MRTGSLLAALAALVSLGACAGEGDIDRTQANRVPKSMFDGTWYMRSTITGVPGTSAASFVGFTGTMEKVRWEVQENVLIAYRAYEEIPGTDSGGTKAAPPGKYKENPIAVFPILSHFDIKREYNASTGEQTNVIVENTTDRPWPQREWMRVDWGNSKVAPQTFDGASGSTQYNSVYFVQPHEKSPDAMRVEDSEWHKVEFEKLATATSAPASSWNKKVNYFDLVGKFLLEPEVVKYTDETGATSSIPLCYFISYNGANYQTASCGPTEVKVRTSFLKVGQRNYESVPLPNREMGKFGFFRTERFSWDRKYGYTESGRIYLANVHNIWEKAYETNPDGSFVLDANKEKKRIAPVDRIPKPVVYWLNENFPCELVSVAQLTADSWNDALRRAVGVAKGLMKTTTGDIHKELDSLPSTPDEATGKNLPETAYVPKQMFRLETNGWVQKDANAGWACSNLQRDESKAIFRLGDLRFNTMAWVQDRQITGPLGYGPSSADPETGEIISGTAHVYGAALDEYAGRALEIVRMLNDDLKVNDVVTGAYVKEYIARNQPVIDPARIPAEARSIKSVRELLPAKVQTKLAAIREKGLEPAKLQADHAYLQKIRGSWLEQFMVDEEIAKGMASQVLTGQPVSSFDDLTPKQLQQLSPLAWNSARGRAIDELRRNKAAEKCIWLREFADDSIQGLAMEVWKKYGAQKDYDAMWQYLREAIFRGVLDHEVGHTVGLRHNFAGSYDSINYFNKYWELRAKPDSNGMGGLKGRAAKSALDFQELYKQAFMTEEQKKNRMSEYQYSTIMDYGSKFNSDIHGIGKFDHAAVLFGYAGYVEVFDKPSNEAKTNLWQRYGDCSPRYESIPNLAYSPVLEQWHYSSIWNMLGQTGGLTTRRFRPWGDVRKEQDDARKACDKFVASGGTVANYAKQQNLNRDLEVPYMFCTDDMVGASVSCQRWDQGADPMEQADYVISSYKNYYFFNNYKRDRFPFTSYQVYSKIASRYLSYLPNIYQHWLFRVAFYGLDDGNLDNYWTIGAWKGFNLLSEIVNKPEYGTYKLDSTKTKWEIQNYNTGESTAADSMVIGRGDGRRRYSRFDYDSGYLYQYQTAEVGHFWDYLAALSFLTASTGTFIGVETSSDFTRYLVPYYIVFEDELTRYFEGAYTDNYAAYAPRIVDTKLFVPPAAALTLNNGKKLDPSTGAEIPATPAGQVLDLNNWFTLKFQTVSYGMAEFRSLYSLRFADRQLVFRVGSGEEVKPGAGMEVVTCEDPIGGHVYGTIRDPKQTTDLGGALRLIQECQTRAAAYKTAAATPGTNAYYSARRDLNDSIEWLNFLRSLYSEFGDNNKYQ